MSLSFSSCNTEYGLLVIYVEAVVWHVTMSSLHWHSEQVGVFIHTMFTLTSDWAAPKLCWPVTYILMIAKMTNLYSPSHVMLTWNQTNKSSIKCPSYNGDIKNESPVPLTICYPTWFVNTTTILVVFLSFLWQCEWLTEKYMVPGENLIAHCTC